MCISYPLFLRVVKDLQKEMYSTHKIISCLYSMLISYSYHLLDNEQRCGQNVVSYPLFLFLNVLN